jgi:hypothetical protein
MVRKSITWRQTADGFYISFASWWRTFYLHLLDIGDPLGKSQRVLETLRAKRTEKWRNLGKAPKK